MTGAARGQWLDARPEGHIPTRKYLLAWGLRSGELDLVCEPSSGVLRGRVLDQRGLPVANATVALASHYYGKGPPGKELSELQLLAQIGPHSTVELSTTPYDTRTDGDGLYEVIKPAARQTVVRIAAKGLPMHLEVLALSHGDQELDLQFPQPANLAGRVIGYGGEALAGIGLRLESPGVFFAQRGVTSEDGSYRFECLPAGPFRLHTLSGASSTADVWGEAEGALREGESRVLDLTLAEGVALRGRVEHDGQPAHGWLVELCTSPENSRTVKTDADGNFAFDGCPAGTCELKYWDSASPIALFGAKVKAGPSPVVLQVWSDYLAQLRGRVVSDPAGLRPEFVALLSRETGKQVIVPLEPEDDTFTSPFVPRGRYDVDLAFAGVPGLWKAAEAELDGEAELEITAPGTGGLTLDLEIPAGCALDQVSVFVRVRVPGHFGALLPVPFVAERGAFCCELPTGTYPVIVTFPGYPTQRMEVDIHAGHTQSLRVQPKEGRTATLLLELPRKLGPSETFELTALEPGRSVPLQPLFRPSAGVPVTLTASIDLSFDTTVLRVSSSNGLEGELVLEPGWLATAQVLRIKLDSSFEK